MSIAGCDVNDAREIQDYSQLSRNADGRTLPPSKHMFPQGDGFPMRRTTLIAPSINANTYGGILIQLPKHFSFINDAPLSLIARLCAEIKRSIQKVSGDCVTGYSKRNSYLPVSFLRGTLIQGAQNAVASADGRQWNFLETRLPEKQVGHFLIWVYL